MNNDRLALGVQEAARADLHVGDYVWPFQSDNAEAIDAHWDAARAANPGFFNGDVYMTSAATMANDAVAAAVFKTNFKTVLYWRSLGYPDNGAIDGFGSAIIRSADGATVFCKQRAGQINTGMLYFPGGFIDNADMTADGRVDIVASVMRELEEETGLSADDGAIAPRLLLTRVAYQLSYGVSFIARQPAEELVARINRRLDADEKSELECVIAVRSLRELENVAMPPYARLLAERLLTP